MKAIITALLIVMVLWCEGCAHYPVNARLKRFDGRAGYRFENVPADGGGGKNTDEVFVVLAFSGGGSRAAGFSYGVLEELAKTRIGHEGIGAGERSLLDEVDVITSVSGSSFTAAYYALRHEKTFDEFPQKYLHQDMGGRLWAAAANPVNWARLASPAFDRVDLAAEDYDREVFNGATYGDLIKARQRPYLLLTAADISLGRRFEFTQEQFDFLYSDLASVPLARAVAASAAFPVFLSPVAFENYPHGTDFAEPAWVPAALGSKDALPRLARRAGDLRSYEDTANRPHVRLLDGAMADYMGLRAPLEALQSTEGDFSIRRMIEQGRIKKLVVISVNSVRTPPIVWDRRIGAPNWYDVLWFTAETPIRNNSFDAVMEFKEMLAADQAALAGQKRYVEALRRTDPAAAARVKILPEYQSYFVTVDFAGVKDAGLRQRLENVKTGLSLKAGEVDDLRRGAAAALRDSEELRRVIRELE
jgi:hypothetical protein